MVFLERTSVSRKTPRDGKLEISRESADRLRSAGAALTVRVGDTEGPGAVMTMPCGCKGAATHVEHVFLQAEELRALAPELSVELSVDPGVSPARVYVRPS
jgi:hypothetical protein